MIQATNIQEITKIGDEIMKIPDDDVIIKTVVINEGIGVDQETEDNIAGDDLDLENETNTEVIVIEDKAEMMIAEGFDQMNFDLPIHVQTQNKRGKIQEVENYNL